MKAVIQAVCLGLRIREVTHLGPRSMLAIGGQTILWHISKIYSSFVVNGFPIFCGCTGYLIKV